MYATLYCNRKGAHVFGLPLETAIIMSVIPAGWLLYTLGFWVFSRDWQATENEGD
ncbi:hypothetical protein CKALI_11635 [Corynebacterium kalinowskii]|uniref:Uncharacterized protein n=1 Tax=Corynebacterium kalinowskii TaxID=2675216 RepID=A0A6B8VJE5_9CORY|nr:hypothetical protein CKALI_11635 [Corynebacterium kalinowskii]